MLTESSRFFGAWISGCVRIFWNPSYSLLSPNPSSYCLFCAYDLWASCPRQQWPPSSSWAYLVFCVSFAQNQTQRHVSVFSCPTFWYSSQEVLHSAFFLFRQYLPTVPAWRGAQESASLARPESWSDSSAGGHCLWLSASWTGAHPSPTRRAESPFDLQQRECLNWKKN